MRRTLRIPRIRRTAFRVTLNGRTWRWPRTVVTCTLAQIVSAAVDTIPGVDAGGISLIENGHIGSRSPTNVVVRNLDELQASLREGPCITAVSEPSEDGVVHAPDLSVPPDSDRWPTFAPRAVDAGYRSLLSTRLVTELDPGTRAALNLYSRTPGTFDESAQTLARLFALQAAILLYGAHHTINITAALDTRDVIGQAKGILMERFNIDDDRAFQMLVRSSQETNVKLTNVARWLTGPEEGRSATLRSDNDG